jgi:hypothetical protein
MRTLYDIPVGYSNLYGSGLAYRSGDKNAQTIHLPWLHDILCELVADFPNLYVFLMCRHKSHKSLRTTRILYDTLVDYPNPRSPGSLHRSAYTLLYTISTLFQRPNWILKLATLFIMRFWYL